MALRQGKDIIKSVYSTLFLGNLKLRKLQNESRMQQAVDAFVDMVYFSSITSMGEYVIYCVRLLHVCSFNSFGQCEGLKLWDGQDVMALTLFSFHNNAFAESYRCIIAYYDLLKKANVCSLHHTATVLHNKSYRFS